MGEERNAYTILVTEPKCKNYLEDLGIEGRTLLKYFFKNRLSACGLDLSR
jgi:hypothetical protein